MKTFHPNGFTVRLLHTFWNGARLRLHTWAADRSNRSDPHDHRTWFISIPLWGRFVEYRYEEIPGNISTFRCRSTTSLDRLDTQEDGKSGVKFISKHVRYPFIPYFCSQDVIHSYAPLKKKFAASIVLFGPPTKKVPRAWIYDEWKT